MKLITKCLLLIVPLLLVFSGCKNDDDAVNPSTQPVTPNDFLSEKNYTSLVIEVAYVAGYAPSTTTLDNLKTFLQARLNKSAGITFSMKSIASPGKTTYTLDDVKAVEDANRTVSNSGKKLTAFFFFADADNATNSSTSKVLGTAYSRSSMVIFEKTVKDLSGGVGKPSTVALETTVMNHEFGHILGLVNNGTSLQSAHEDTAHARHCTAETCLMYYMAETSDMIGNLMGGGVPSLDEQCIADLKANGGR